MLTPEKTTFHRAQTDSIESLTVYFSIDSVDAVGRPVDAPWQSRQVVFTDDEKAVIAAMIARARHEFCDEVNAALASDSGISHDGT